MSRLTVVVLNWNREAATERCLRGLTGWERLRPEIRAVDNGSTEGVKQLKSVFPEVKWHLSETNLGFGGGNNLALREVSSRYVLLLNNDAEIDEADAEHLLDLMDRDPSLLAIGPVIVDDSGSHRKERAGGRDVAWNVATHWNLSELPASRLLGEGLFEVNYVPGTAVVLRVLPLRELGYLDERYFFGGELADICERARHKGLRAAVLTTASARHDGAVASEWREGLYPYYILRNRFLFVRRLRRREAVLLLPFWTAYGVLAVMRFVLTRQPTKARILTLALVDGLLGRCGDGTDRVLGGEPKKAHAH